MKTKNWLHYPILLLCCLLSISCGTDSIECDLHGRWVYERETFRSFSSFDDPDVSGTIEFREDESGIYDSSAGFTHNIEWDLQMEDRKIAITKYFSSVISEDFTNTRVYDLTQSGQDQFTFTFLQEFESLNDTILGSTIFENMILTRID